MSSIRWGIIAAVLALVVSVTLGIISGVGAGYIILRASIFTVVFFGLGIGLRILMNNYFPELLYFGDDPAKQADMQQGSRVDITLGSGDLENDGEYAVPEMFRDSEKSNELGNIEDLISGAFRVMPEKGIDPRREDDYNDKSGTSIDEFKAFEPAETVRYKSVGFTPSFGSDSDDLGALPDLGALATAFSSSAEPQDSTALGSITGGLEELESMPSFGAAEPAPYQKKNTPKPLKGDFDPKELADGIRTILNTEK